MPIIQHPKQMGFELLTLLSMHFRHCPTQTGVDLQSVVFQTHELVKRVGYYAIFNQQQSYPLVHSTLTLAYYACCTTKH